MMLPGSIRLRCKTIFFLLLAMKGVIVNAQSGPISVTTTARPGCFSIVSAGKAAPLVIDPQDAEVTAIAAKAFSKDIQLMTSLQPAILQSVTAGSNPVIIGTLGKSAFIDQLAAKGVLQVAAVKGKWETFCLTVVDNPVKGVAKALVIFGSDPRGTAFGVFELSRMLGVSPFVWWADVVPAKTTSIYVSPGQAIIGPPSVKYRGIFINDEDWGLQPWAAKNMDTTIKDIGPETYARVFELMLRLKANYLWPAMHPCTKAFWYYPENPILARKYDIILGASHCEPLLRGNVFEWAVNFKNEYGVEPGEWRYDVNKQQIDRYWNDRVKASVNNPAVYTVGMRGIHDSGMPGPESKEGKKSLLEEVIRNQRAMLSEGLGKPAADIPQIFCPYKEVLDLYRLGMDLPEDITLAWADDNYGFVRQLPNPDEQKRSGGSGVYYHFSYWGWPEDYLWLSTISPVLTSYELTKAYELKADKLWIFNVGDIKPTELEMQFALDFAWDVKAWTPEKAHRYVEHWAAATFGKEFAKSIGQIKSEYYRLAAAGKPEQLNAISYSDAEAGQRLKAGAALIAASRSVEKKIPARLKDAYFQLITYPVEAACSMNEKILYARKSLQLAEAGNRQALAMAKKATNAYRHIQQLTEQYNTVIAGGKWNGMMSSHPRDLKVFKMPRVATADMIKKQAAFSSPANGKSIMIPASAHLPMPPGEQKIKAINGLGTGKSALTVWPMQLVSYEHNDIANAPYAEYNIPVRSGSNTIAVRCLPDFPLYAGRKLRYAISIDGAPPEFVSIATLAETKPWAINILRGYAKGETTFQSNSTGQKKIRIYFPDPGLVVNEIEVINPVN